MKEGFKLPEDGLYSGFDAATADLRPVHWNYEEGGDVGRATPPALREARPRALRSSLPAACRPR